MSHTGRNPFNPQASASIAIMGTFVVNLPAITATTPTYSTIVTCNGLTAQHMLMVFNQGLVSGATANNSGSTCRILFSSQPQDGQMTLTYVNNAATHAATDVVYSFVAATI